MRRGVLSPPSRDDRNAPVSVRPQGRGIRQPLHPQTAGDADPSWHFSLTPTRPRGLGKQMSLRVTGVPGIGFSVQHGAERGE